MIKKILFVITLTFLVSDIFAQTNIVGEKYIYEFRDGTTIIGTFIKDEGGNIYINDLAGNEIYIPRVMVAQIHNVTKDNLKDDEYWFPNLHDSRYFFSPSAYGLEEGEGYYSNSYWWLWQAQYGLSDNLSIGAGTTPIGIPSSVNIKFSTKIAKDINYAFGWFWVGDLFGWTDGNMGSLLNMPYLVATKGSKEKNFTLGAAYNFATPFDDDNVEMNSNRLVLNSGGTVRLSRRFAFVFEAWLLNSGEEGNKEFHLMGGPGIRYFRKVNRVTPKNGAGAKTWDFQLMHFPGMSENGGPIFIPMIGTSKRF